MFGSQNGSLTQSMHRHQLKHYDETMKRAHGFKYQHCESKLKKTSSETTEGPAKDAQWKYKYLVKVKGKCVLFCMKINAIVSLRLVRMTKTALFD